MKNITLQVSFFKMGQQYGKLCKKEIFRYHPDAVDFLEGITKGAELAYIDVIAPNVTTENMITCPAWGAAKTTLTLCRFPWINYLGRFLYPADGFVDVLKNRQVFRYPVDRLILWFWISLIPFIPDFTCHPFYLTIGIRNYTVSYNQLTINLRTRT